jgi:hypothetical protein
LGEPYRLGDAGEFRLEAGVAGMLYTYQLEGVAWLYRLHTLQRGGILAGGHRRCGPACVRTTERNAAAVCFVAATLCSCA